MYRSTIILASVLIATGYALPVVPSSSGFDPSLVLTPLSSLTDTSQNVVASLAKAKTVPSGFPDSGRQSVVLEQKYRESIPIKLDDKYGQLQQFVASITNPKPIVDTIEEHEKYGNDASKGRAVATTIIGGYEAFSNILNTIVDFPFTKAREFGKSITSSLNVVGGKLVGLA